MNTLSIILAALLITACAPRLSYHYDTEGNRLLCEPFQPGVVGKCIQVEEGLRV